MKIEIFGKYRIYFSVHKIETRYGVSSKKYDEDDKHILLWDFDDASYSNIRNNLFFIQHKYSLPRIFILESSEKHYHAWCFCSRSLQEIIHILSDTSGIDIEYLCLGMMRGYYTLRFSPKNYNELKLVEILDSRYVDEMDMTDVSISKYFTTNI